MLTLVIADGLDASPGPDFPHFQGLVAAPRDAVRALAALLHAQDAGVVPVQTPDGQLAVHVVQVARLVIAR